MINHVEECTQFTIDTESERSNGQLALIQVQDIPPRIPLLVILIELAHLPPNNSHVYAKIKKLFEMIFRFGNKLYLWGDMSKELDPSKGYRLFNWPILASIVDIQPRFSRWYEWALTQCESCRPKHHLNGVNDINVTTQNYSSLMCACHEQSPYGPQEKWPPQKALIYAAHMFSDKSHRINNWTGGLTGNNSILSLSRRKKKDKLCYF